MKHFELNLPEEPRIELDWEAINGPQITLDRPERPVIKLDLPETPVVNLDLSDTSAL